jgi:DICT domain-containing protein
MVKAFDPSKAREQAEATIKAAQDVRAKLVEKVEKATKRLADATTARDAAQAKVDEQDTLIQRQQNYLAATAELVAAPAPDAEVVASTEGQEQVFAV